MAKLQVYKFVNPGAGKSTAPEIAAARQSLLSSNRLGIAITGIGTQVVDINKITNLRVKAADRAEIAQRREKRRQMDAEAENLQERVAGKKNLSEYFKKKSKIKYKPKDFGSFLKGTFGWIQGVLKPFVDLFIKIGALALMNDLLKWAEDEKNIEALSTFLEKTSFVFEKIFNFGAWIVQDNLLDGFDQLFGSETSFLGRVEGLGKMMVGIIGLKYLMNPFSIITDIIFLANIISGAGILSRAKGCLPKGFTKKINPRNKGPLSRGRTTPTTSGGGSTGPLRSVREFFNKLKPKTKLSGSGSKPSLVKQITNAFKKKPTVSGGVKPSGNFLTNLFKKKPNVTGVKPSIVKPKISIPKPKISGAGAVGGLRTLGASFVLDWLVGMGFSAIEQKQMEGYLNKFQSMSDAEQTAEIARKEKIRANVFQRTQGFSGAFTKIITLGGLAGPDNDADMVKKVDAELKAMYQIRGETYQSEAMNSDEYQQIYDKVPEKNKDTKGNSFDILNPANDKKKGLFGWGFLGLEHGGELPQFFFGGLVKSIGRAVSGVVKTVSNVVSGVVNTAVKVVSNPIVNTALSFVPGIGPVVQAINAVTALSQGNIVGAITSGIGAVGNFAAIGSTARSVVDTPNWLMNLRMSKFGRGISNLYTKGANLFGRLSGTFSNLYNNVTGSKLGKIGMQLLGGNMGGAIGEVVGMMPGLSGGIENFGNWLEKNQLQGILGAVPGVQGLLKNVPNIMNIPGMAKILGAEGYQFSAMNAIGSVADRAGMKGIYNAILAGHQSGDVTQGLRELAPELGVDPRILGVLDKGRSLLRNNKFNAEYAMQTAIEFLPVPLIVEKLIAAPTPVPINSGDTYLVAPSSTQSR